MKIMDDFKSRYQDNVSEELTIQEYLEICLNDPTAYASPAERMILAIGEPKLVDTGRDPTLGRIFQNRVIKYYPAFKDFFGMEDVIENIMSYFKHSSQGLEESKQILYLLGPVGGGKSSLAEKLKSLMESFPIYAIKGSPINENPLSLFSSEEDKIILEQEYKIPRHRLNGLCSPWATKRLQEYKGDISQFKVVKLCPSILKQIAIAKTEPGDENNQDISSLVGKVDIRMLEYYQQSDTDAYNYSGALCKAHQGLLEFVEMFKAPMKSLHPLLTATQEGNYKPTEDLAAIPSDSIIMAHSNESEWNNFKNNKNNEAFLDRIYVVKVPYCTRVSEEVNIYKKLLENSMLKDAPCAPKTLEMLASFAILTRIKDPENSSIYSKLRIYDGESLKDTDPKAKSHQEYKDYAGYDEAMDGISTRFAFKILAKVFNYSHDEIAANPVHLLSVLERSIDESQFPKETHDKYLTYIKEYLCRNYIEFIGKELRHAYLTSYSEVGQTIFNRYVTYADYWVQGQEYVDPTTGTLLKSIDLNLELEKIEKPAGISNPKDFRNEIVNFVLRNRAKENGENPVWTSYEKLRIVIEKKIFATTEEILPILSFSNCSDGEHNKKHEKFISRMVEKGYTKNQVRLLCDWYMRINKRRD